MPSIFINQTRILPTIVIAIGWLLFYSANANAENIIFNIISSPKTSNGLDADAPTNINILFRSSDNNVKNSQALDPINPGQFIPPGGYLELDLGGTFSRNPDFKDSLTGLNEIRANANFVLTTTLQNPIVSTQGDGVQHGNWRITDNNNRLITMHPNGANGLDNARAADGFKTIQVKPSPDDRTTMDRSPFINGPAGTYGMIYVRIFDTDGMLYKMGSIEVKFNAPNGPQVRLSNDGLTTSGIAQLDSATTNVDKVESVYYQHVAAKSELKNVNKSVPFSSGKPYALRFILFTAASQQPDAFVPQKGLSLVGYYINPENPSKATLVQDSNGNGIADQDDKVIGKIKIKGPDSNSNGTILASSTLTTSGDGKIGANGSILNVPVQVGSETGKYKITLSLKNGNKVANYVIVDN